MGDERVDDEITESASLVDVLDQLTNADLNGDGAVSIEEMLDLFGDRAFGPLFATLALIQILPTGIIPGVTDVVALCTLLLSWQLLIGAERPWVPKKLLSKKLNASKVQTSCKKARPWAEKVSRWFGPRADELVNTATASRFIALQGMLLSLLMFTLGFIPGAADPVALALLILGLGLTCKDGWAVLLSYAGTAITLFGFALLANRIF